MIILMVDDTPSVRRLVGKVVKSGGFTLAEAGDGVEGLAKLAELKAAGTPPKLIISDYNMPNMNGIAFVKAVRQQDRSTPILMLTTLSEASKKAEVKQAGGNGWVEKPLSPGPFLATVKKLAGV